MTNKRVMKTYLIVVVVSSSSSSSSSSSPMETIRRRWLTVLFNLINDD